MNALQEEFARLYCTKPSHPGPDIRAMVVELSRPADWTALSSLWQGVQVDLEWPAPAIAVNGTDGYQLWFSVLEPIPAVQAHAILQALQKRYLGSIVNSRLQSWPYVDGSLQEIHSASIPAKNADTGRWSAFIASDLAAIFGDEPWLDLEPHPEAQAAMLSRLESIKPKEFEAAYKRLVPSGEEVRSLVDVDKSGLQSQDLNPRRFLQDVLNDPTVDLQIRVEAAKALLPYFP